jgi:hypothetical protein
MAVMNLYDLYTLQRNDTLTGLVEDVTTAAPEWMTIPAIPRPGTFYYLARRTALPTAAFRNINAGTTPSKSTYKKEIKEMFFLEALINMDEAIEQGDDKSLGDVWMNEAEGANRAAIITLGAQVWYGTSADAKGFAGVRAQLSGNIGAGGSTNSTSAYLLWMDPKQGVRFDVGNGGQIAMRPPVRQQIADPADSTKTLFAWVGNLSMFIGMAVVSDKATWAVTGCDSSHKLTDTLAAQLISNIPVARRNNLRWYLNRSNAYYLQSSRTAIAYQPANAGGQPAWSPYPDKLEGYPITLTDSITNTESN